MKEPITRIDDPTPLHDFLHAKQKSFDEVFDKYSKKVYGFSKTYFLSHEDAEEIVQEVFIKVWGIIDQLDASQSIHSYIITITKNTILNFLRNKAVQQKHLLHIIPKNQIQSDVEEALNYRELLNQLNNCVSLMPVQRRRIYKLVFFDCLSTQEVATKLGLSKRTIEHHLYLANTFVREELVKTRN